MQTLQEKAIKSGVPAFWLIDFLEQNGISRAIISQKLGLDHRLFASGKMILSAEIFDRIFEWAAEDLENQDLGLDLAKFVEPQHFGLLSYLESNTGTVADFCRMLETYHRVFSPEYSVHLHEFRDGFFLEYKGPKIECSHSRQDIDFSVSVQLRVLRQRIGEDWSPIRVRFTYPEPKDTRALEEFFGCELYFDQVATGIEFGQEVADIAKGDTDEVLLEILKRYVDGLLDKVGTKDSLVQKVRILISTNLGSTDVSTTFVADKLHLSVRNLHNQLKRKDMSFKKLKDEVVLELAREALAESDISVTQIGLRLGYSESSAFIRMFKRLEGLSPLQFRRKWNLE